MTVDPQWHVPPGANPAWDALSAWLIQSGAPRTDQRGGLRGLPAGPGLSALDMAAACLCCADPAAFSAGNRAAALRA
jgi:hypothetical protein